jgi:ferritin-like protein
MQLGRRPNQLIWRPADFPEARRPMLARVGDWISDSALWQGFAFSPLTSPAVPNPVLRALTRTGLPTLSDPLLAQDPAMLAESLLDTAAELEHALMIEYLYAAYSTPDPRIAGTFASIARQEMGHLATVQNLRMTLQLSPYFGRQDQAPQPDRDPFLFRREPLSLDALAKYCIAEMPAKLPAGVDPQLVAEIRRRAAAATGSDVHRVGAIYAMLYWIFLATDPTGSRPWQDFPEQEFRDKGIPQLTALPGSGTANFHAEPGEWRAGSHGLHVVVCGSGADALAALEKVAAQGEGLSSEPNSHFLKFVGLYQQGVQGGLSVYPVPVDPQSDPARPGVLITHPLSLAASAVLDAIYAAMQIQILLSFRLDRTGPKRAERLALIRRCINDDMLGGIAPLMMLLARDLPLLDGQPADDPRRAGAVMTPPPVTGGRLDELVEAWRQAIDAIDQRVAAARQVPDPGGQLGGYLAGIAATLDTKRQLLARIIA